MTIELVEPAVREPIPPTPVDDLGDTRFPARVPATAWPVITAGRDEVTARLSRPPFVLRGAASQKHRSRGLGLLLDWLSDQPGDSWQQRWLASGVDAAAADW